MIMIKLLRSFRGPVRFSATGGAVERLINLTAQNKLNLWDFRKTAPGVFEGYTIAKEYKSLARLARKAGVKTRVRKRFGIPFIIHKYRRRLGVFIGLAAVLLFILVMQNFIWSIEVSGNQTISSESILATMEELGIHKGAFTPSLDFKSIELAARARIKGVSWVAVNQTGSKVWIEVQESVKAPEIIPDAPCNIVASKAGQIVELQVFSGQAVVSKGEAVDKGDLIVSGVIEDPTGNTTMRRASAKVTAVTQFEKIITVPLSTQQKTYTGETKNRYILDFFGLKLPLYLATKQDGEYDLSSSYQKLTLFGAQLPFGLYTNEYKFFETQTTEYTEQQASEQAQQLLKEYEDSDLKEAEILDKQTSQEVKDGEFRLTVRYTCREEIGKVQEIYTNESEN